MLREPCRRSRLIVRLLSVAIVRGSAFVQTCDRSSSNVTSRTQCSLLLANELSSRSANPLFDPTYLLRMKKCEVSVKRQTDLNWTCLDSTVPLFDLRSLLVNVHLSFVPKSDYHYNERSLGHTISPVYAESLRRRFRCDRYAFALDFW